MMEAFARRFAHAAQDEPGAAERMAQCTFNVDRTQHSGSTRSRSILVSEMPRKDGVVAVSRDPHAMLHILVSQLSRLRPLCISSVRRVLFEPRALDGTLKPTLDAAMVPRLAPECKSLGRWWNTGLEERPQQLPSPTSGVRRKSAP